MSTKLIAVIGATGNQGGALARAILSNPGGPDVRLRAITRNPDSAKARAMATQGAEVVAADIDDAASLISAFAGACGQNVQRASVAPTCPNGGKSTKSSSPTQLAWLTRSSRLTGTERLGTNPEEL